MAHNLLITLCLLVQVHSLSGQGVRESILHRTWSEFSHGFTGFSIVFIEDSAGEIKAIYQRHGSGIPVVFSQVFEVTAVGDSIFLADTIGQRMAFAFEKERKLLRGKTELKVTHEMPVIFVSETPGGVRTKWIDLNLASRISFETNQVFLGDGVFEIE